MKVDKFWKGLRREFQHDLWRDKLNPEVSTLKEVVAAAEIIEISKSVMTGPKENKPFKRHDNTVVRSAATTPDGAGDAHQRGNHHRQRGRRGKDRQRSNFSGHKPSKVKTETNDTRANYRKKECTSRPKLSKDEEERRKTEGLCLNCSGAGHFSRNCPQRNKVPSTLKHDSPPGVTSYGMGLDFGDIECQQELSKASASGIHVNLMDLFDSDDDGNDMVNLPGLVSDEYSLTETETLPATPANTSEEDESSEDAESEASEWYPCKYPFCRVPTDFGEPLSERARGRLASTCYPREDPDDPAVYARDRFWVYRVKNGFHVVMDDLYPFEDGLLIASRWLQNPQFHIDRWYWRIIGQMKRIPDEEIRWLEQRRVGYNLPMGRPVEDQILGRLIRSINPWASIDEDTRFTCSCREETAAYEINDATTHTHILLPIYKTENPHFNVARWYN